MKFSIRILYLYLFSFVGLLIIVIGSIRLVDLGIKTFIFKDSDKYEIYPVKIEGEEVESVEVQEARQKRESKRQKQRELSGSISMILVGVPLYLYHWRTIQKENKNTTV